MELSLRVFGPAGAFRDICFAKCRKRRDLCSGENYAVC